MNKIIPNYHPNYPDLRIDGLFRCCNDLHYTSNMFKPTRCPVCDKSIIMGNYFMFCINNNIPVDEMIP